MNTPTIAAEWESLLGQVESDGMNGKGLLGLPENRFLEPLVKPGLDILEAGSGNGRYVFAFARAGAKAVGLDFSPRLTEKVQEQAQQMNFKNVLAVTGDMMNLPFEEERFDLYTSFGVYEHFVRRQHEVLFAEAYRVLKPGGLLYLEVPQFWSAWTVRREFRYWFRKFFPPRMVWQSNMRRSYMTQRAEEAGFATVESHVFDTWYGFQKGFSLDRAKLRAVPNPFYFCRSAFKSLAQMCDAREWLGHTLVYIGRKPKLKLRRNSHS